MVNGFSGLVLTKIDKLDRLDVIRVCTGYTLNGKLIEVMPETEDLYHVKPIYHKFHGWQSDTTKCKCYSELPENAKKYVEFIENHVEVPIVYIGNGPARDNIISRL